MRSIISLFMLLPSLGLASGYDISQENKYRMNGIIVGYMLTQDENKCFLAIKDDTDARHSYGYHEVPGKHLCSLAKAMHLLRTPVSMIAVDNRDNRRPNTVTDLASISDARVFWAPDAGGYGNYRKDELR